MSGNEYRDRIASYASVFGLWSQVLPSERLFGGEQLSLPSPAFSRVTTPKQAAAKDAPRKSSRKRG